MNGSNNATGTATSAPASARVNPSQAPTMQAPQIGQYESPFMESLRAMQAQTSIALGNSEKNLTDANSFRIKSLLPFEKDSLLSKIKYTNALTLTEKERKELVREQTENLFEQNSLMRATFANNVALSSEATMQARAQTTLMGLGVKERLFAEQYFEPQAWVNFSSSLQNLANAVVQGDIGEKQLKFMANQIFETYWRGMNYKQQYNINKPLETKSLFENEALNSDAGIYETYTDEDGNKKTRGGYTMKQGYQMLFRQTFFNSLNSSFNQSLALSLQASEYGISADINNNYLTGRKFINKYFTKYGTFATDYLGKQVGFDLDKIGVVAPFLSSPSRGYQNNSFYNPSNSSTFMYYRY